MLEEYYSRSETSEDLSETVTQSLATLSPLVMWNTDKGINEPVWLAGMTSKQNVNILLFKQPEEKGTFPLRSYWDRASGSVG